jgi:hypothetical protein
MQSGHEEKPCLNLHKDFALQRRRCRRSNEKLWRGMEILGSCGSQFRALMRRIGNPRRASRFLPNHADVVELIGVPEGFEPSFAP